MCKRVWHPSLKPFLYAIRIVDVFFAIEMINATCKVSLAIIG